MDIGFNLSFAVLFLTSKAILPCLSRKKQALTFARKNGVNYGAEIGTVVLFCFSILLSPASKISQR